jgi:tetratricopeptide (TPR) repeat protein
LSLADLALCQLDLDQSAAWGREALATFRALGHAKGIGHSLHAVAVVSAERGEYDDAERLLEEGILAAREAQDRLGIAKGLGDLGDVAIRRGMYDRATALTIEGLAIFRELGGEDHIGWALYNLALCHVFTGRHEEAAQVATESLIVSRKAGNVSHLSWGLVLAAALIGRRGDQEFAARILGATDALGERIGLVLSGAEAELHDETVAKVQQALGPRYEAAFADGRAMSLDDAVALALEMLDERSVAQTEV